MYNAEKAVIGCLLTDIENIEKINLTPEMFRDSDLGRIFFEIKKLADDGEKVDATLIASRLSDMFGIIDLLVECMEGVTMSAVQVTQFADEVLNDYKARMMSKILSVKPDAKNIGGQIESVIRQLEVLDDGKDDKSETIGEIATRYKGEHFTENRKQGIKCGIHSVDRIIQGMDDGDLILIAARPAVGKTAFAMQIAMNISKELNTDFISLEMSKEQLYDRIIAYESGIELNRIRRACGFVGAEYEMFNEANEALTRHKLRIVDDVDTVSDIYRSLKRHKADVAIIDYAQLIKPESRYKGNRYAEVGDISHGLKKAAKRLNIPIILLTQLNRVKVETSEPTMAEIRESGDFEQDAAVIVLLWNKTDDRTQKGVKVDKNRNGETGKTELYFDGKIMKFSEFTKGDNPFD